MTVPNVLKNNPKIREALAAEVTSMLKSGEEVSIGGIGKFSVAHRAARTGRNPITGAAVDVPAKNAVKFGAAKALKDAINS